MSGMIVSAVSIKLAAGTWETEGPNHALQRAHAAKCLSVSLTAGGIAFTCTCSSGDTSILTSKDIKHRHVTAQLVIMHNTYAAQCMAALL